MVRRAKVDPPVEKNGYGQPILQGFEWRFLEGVGNGGPDHEWTPAGNGDEYMDTKKGSPRSLSKQRAHTRFDWDGCNIWVNLTVA